MLIIKWLCDKSDNKLSLNEKEAVEMLGLLAGNRILILCLFNNIIQCLVQVVKVESVQNALLAVCVGFAVWSPAMIIDTLDRSLNMCLE